MIRRNQREWCAVARMAALGALMWAATAQQANAQAPTAAGAAPTAFASEEARDEAIGKVRLLADQVHALRSDAARVQGLGAIGRAACAFDKELARQTFHRAHEIAQRASASDAATLRRSLVPLVARCDGDLAYRLNSEARDEASERSATGDALAAINASHATINENPALAAQFLGRAMQTPLDDPYMQSAMSAMLALRARDGAAADAIFLATLARLRTELRPEAMRLLALGNYLFVSPPLPGVPQELMANAVVFTTVGAGRRGSVGTYNLMADRPGMNAALVRPYLEAALDILSRPTQDAQQQAADFVALHQLIDKVPRFAPELAAPFALLRERLAPNVSDLLRDPGSYKTLSDPGSGPSAADMIARESDPAKRDLRRLRALASAATRNSTGEARKHVSEIEDKELREQALLLLQFYDAGRAVAEGRLLAAEEAARLMPPGVKRALLALSLAAALHGKGEREKAESWWKTAAADAQTSDYSARANLLLAATAVGMRFDREAALVSLASAVAAFNRSEEPERVTDEPSLQNRLAAKASASQNFAVAVIAYPGGFLQEIYYGDYPSQFRLTAPGVDTWDFTATLMSGVGRDVERAHAIVLQLEDESRRANALASMARAYFENATKKAEPATAAKP